MSERISLDFIGARLAMLQEGMKDLRDSHESVVDRVSAVEASLTNLGNQVLRHLVLQDRRITRVEQRLDGMTRRLERVEETQLRLADMLSDTRQEVQALAAEQARIADDVREVLRRLPPAPG